MLCSFAGTPGKRGRFKDAKLQDDYAAMETLLDSPGALAFDSHKDRCSAKPQTKTVLFSFRFELCFLSAGMARGDGMGTIHI